MAEAAKGGWVRRAATSTASVRPWAAAIATVSAATGRGDAGEDPGERLLDRQQAHGRQDRAS